jgi:hypothetical protein
MTKDAEAGNSFIVNRQRDSGAWIAIAALAGCVLLPYNCLLTAQPYFDRHVFPGLGFPFTSMLCYSCPLCLGQAVLTFTSDGYTVQGRMFMSFIGTLLVCAAFVVISYFSYGSSGQLTNVLYGLCLAITVALALMNALMQTTILGLAGAMGRKLSAAAMVGFGFIGLLAFFISVVLDLAVGSNGTGPMVQAVVLFLFCVAYTAFSVWIYYGWFRHNSSAVTALGLLEENRSARTPEIQQGSPTGLLSRLRAGRTDQVEGSPDVINLPRRRNSVVMGTVPVLKEIAGQAINVLLVFMCTMTLFPGIVTKWEPGALGLTFFAGRADLFTRVLVGLFQIFDVIGRYIAGCIASRFPPRLLWVLVCMRFLLVPAFMLGQKSPTSSLVWGSDMGRFALVSLLALTNGLGASLAMMFGPQMCSSEDRKEVAGIAMSCTMVTGILGGTLLAFLTQL